MQVKLEVDCTPAEARAFLGLPDVSALNAELTTMMRERMTAAMSAGAPDELMRQWFSLGGQATDMFRQLMTTSLARGAAAER